MRNTVNKFTFLVECKDVRNKILMETLVKDGYEVHQTTEAFNPKGETFFYVYSPTTLISTELAESLEQDSFLLAFRYDTNAKEILKKRNINFICIQEDEVFAHKNAVLTAEGTLSLIITNTEKALFSSNILILGYGRLGKALCKVLQPLSNVYASVTNSLEEGIANIFLQEKHFKLEDLGNRIHEFDVIVNTIPTKILTHSLLDKCKAFILDLASLPGGLDFDYAKEKDIKFLHALGIPSKFAPLDASNFIYEKIKEVLKNSKN